MKITTLQALAAAALIGLSACKAVESDANNAQTYPVSSSVAASEKASSEKPKTQSSRPAEASARRTTTVAPKGMVATSVAFPTGDPGTSAVLIEKVLPQQVHVGKPFTYETKVTNLASYALENVVITETKDANFQLSASEPKAASAGMEGNAWNLGTLAPNATRTIRVTGTAKKEETIQNCMSVTYDTSLCTVIPVVAPALRLVAAGPTEIIQCDELVYSYVVTNPGSGAAKDVVVSAQLPKGLTMNGKSSFTHRVGTLEPGKSAEFQMKAQAGQTGRFEHVASATAGEGLQAKAERLSTTVRKPKFEVAITGQETRIAGRDVTYDITVKNVGDGIAKKATLETSLPAKTKVVSSTAGSKVSGGTIAWNLGDLAPGKVSTFQVKLGTSEIGRITPRASARAECADLAVASFTTELRGIPAVLMEVVDVEDPIELGADETYIVSITNQGTAPATNVKIAIELPANVIFVNATGDTRVIGGNAAVVRTFQFQPLPSLAPKAKATWHVTVKGNTAADARFRVSLTSDQLTSPVEESEATTFYE